MTKTPAWRRYLRFWGADVAGDVDEELRFHIEMRVAEYVARGMTEAEARRTVMARLGDVDAARAECIALGEVRERQARRADFFGGLRADVRFALRSLGEDPAARLGQLAASVQPDKSRIVIESVREKLDRTMAEPRFTMRVLTAFAALGVLLAAIGLFGVISYNVGQRTREIGVRMTLGATRGAIARLVVGDGIRLALAGIALGLLGAVTATRLIRGLLYGVSRLDPFSFGAGAALLLAISVVACVAPMLRATGIDPAIAVRSE